MTTTPSTDDHRDQRKPEQEGVADSRARRHPDVVLPVWLVDVDGVVNAKSPRGWGSMPHQALGYAFGKRWRLRWAPALVEQMSAWHQEGRVELRWATTWCPFVDQLETLWGFPVLQRCLNEQEAASRPAATAAKLRAAVGVLELENRPLIWTDDDAIPQDAETLVRLRPVAPPSLLITPRENRGLTRDDLATIDDFLTALAQ